MHTNSYLILYCISSNKQAASVIALLLSRTTHSVNCIVQHGFHSPSLYNEVAELVGDHFAPQSKHVLDMVCVSLYPTFALQIPNQKYSTVSLMKGMGLPGKTLTLNSRNRMGRSTRQSPEPFLERKQRVAGQEEQFENRVLVWLSLWY